VSDTRARFGRLIRDFLAAHPQSQSWSVAIEPWTEASDEDVQEKRIAFKVTAKAAGDGGYDLKVRPLADVSPEDVAMDRRALR